MSSIADRLPPTPLRFEILARRPRPTRFISIIIIITFAIINIISYDKRRRRRCLFITERNRSLRHTRIHPYRIIRRCCVDYTRIIITCNDITILIIFLTIVIFKVAARTRVRRSRFPNRFGQDAFAIITRTRVLRNNIFNIIITVSSAVS